MTVQDHFLKLHLKSFSLPGTYTVHVLAQIMIRLLWLTRG